MRISRNKVFGYRPAVKRMALTFLSTLAVALAQAQAIPGGDTPALPDDHHKDYLHNSIALGYEAYNGQYGIGALTVQYLGRYYFATRGFAGAKLHLALGKGTKDAPSPKDGSTWQLDQDMSQWAAMAGGGYDLYQSINRRLIVYTQGYLGYGVHHTKQEQWVNNSCPTLKHNDKGLAADMGLGLEWKSLGGYLWGFHIDALDVAGRWCATVTVSFGWV